MSLTNQTAVITGAGSGIGRAIAVALAARKVNLRLIGRRIAMLEGTASLAEGFGVTIRCLAADLTNDSDLAGVGQSLAAEPDGINILVHAAGVIERGPVAQNSLDSFDRHHRLNVRAPYALSAALLPALRARKGDIVFINSSSGVAAKPFFAPYDSSKHALRGLADALRGEVNADGVRVLSVYPGRTASDMQAEIHARDGKPYQPDLLLQPEDIANVVVNILSLPRTAEVTDIHIRPAIRS